MKTILETDRLLLRQFTTDDYDLMYQLNSDAEVMKYILDGKTQSYEEAKAYLDRILGLYAQHPQLGTWAVEWKENNDFVGWACLRPFEQPEKRELGYRLLKKYWGMGIASEISQAIVQYGFQTLNLPQIMAVLVKEHKASWRVLEKAGLRHVGPAFHYNSHIEYFEINKTDFQS